jgi:hypothetical protein
LSRGRAKKPPVENAEVLLPDQVALDIIAVQSLGAEERHDDLAVRASGCICVAALGVAADFWLAAVALASPEDFAVLFVCAVKAPIEISVFFFRFYVSV